MEDREPAQDEAFSIQHGRQGVEGGAHVSLPLAKELLTISSL